MKPQLLQGACLIVVFQEQGVGAGLLPPDVPPGQRELLLTGPGQGVDPGLARRGAVLRVKRACTIYNSALSSCTNRYHHKCNRVYTWCEVQFTDA